MINACYEGICIVLYRKKESIGLLYFQIARKD